MAKKKSYTRKCWLNSKKSSSTGSISIHDGLSPWEPKERTKFIEIADCHVKARLHQAKCDTDKSWKLKVDRLVSELQRYQKFLNKN